MLWHTMTTDKIIGGKTPDGVSYLKLFLKDYSEKFNIDKLNAGCHNCIADYHKKWIRKMEQTIENECGYTLLAKYNGIQLEPCSNIFVNNANITTELAERLLETKGARVFAKMPEQNTIVEPTQTKTKCKRIKKQ